MTPVAFAGCAGWLHQAAGTRGVLILGAHGFEGLCSARFLRHLAEGLAQAGLTCLRFDLPGTGDSLGHDTDPARWAAWQTAADAALDLLAAHGVREVTVVGLRLGALLAGDLAARRSSGSVQVTALALLAPPSSGRAYAREQTALARLLAPSGSEPGGDGLSVAGFVTTSETLAALKAAEWQAPKNVRRVLLMPQAGNGEPLAGRFASWGAVVAVQPFERYAAMMCDPTASRLATEALASVVDWVAAEEGSRNRTQAPVAPFAAHELHGPGWREQRVRFGPKHLVAVLCEPDHAAFEQPATLILNAGAIPHLGWARAGVDQARALAAAGRASLRLDLAGMGDSPERPGAGEPDLYDAGAREDVRAAVALLRRRGYRGFVLAGTCSGAYQALRVALAEPDVSSVVLVNQLCYRWTPRQALGLALWARSKSALLQARKSPADAAGRPKLPARLFGRLLTAARPAVKAALAFGGQLSGLLGAVFDPEDVEVAGWFKTLDRRGVRVLAVASAGDPSQDEARRLFGPEGLSALASPNLKTLVLPDADHVLTQAPARRALTQALLDATASSETRIREAGAASAAGAPAWVPAPLPEPI